MILMLLFRKEWRILISIWLLTAIHDDIDASIKKEWTVLISIWLLTAVHDDIGASI